MDQTEFKREIWRYYRKNGRSFPWRATRDPYRILVSEIMLQQTQTYRVEPKYKTFIKTFPNFKSLAAASVTDVLRAWQGLGYNRRALYLKKIAEVIVDEHNGRLPEDFNKLRSLPGIGPNTAGSIMAFAFNKPVVFIETNIRRVFIHFFFAGKNNVGDKDILPLIKKSLPAGRQAREWYFALMDYGAMLAKSVSNPNRRSKHYAVQSKFSGSVREARGLILKILLNGPAGIVLLKKQTSRTKEALRPILESLLKEGFILKLGNKWQLAA